MKSIRPRFLLVSAVIIALALTATAFAFTYLFERGLMRQVDNELTNLVNQIAAELEFEADGSLKPPGGLSDRRFETAYGGLYWQIDDPEADDQLRSRSLWDFVLPLPEDTHEVGTIHRYYLPGPENGEVYAQERSLVVATPTGVRTIRISAAIDKAAMDSVKTQFAFDTVPYLAVLGLFLLAASALQLTLGLRPLTRVSEDLKELRVRPNKRLVGPYPKEIGHLVDAVNDLLDTQERTIEKSRARAGDLAHGLKTPLTVLANHADILRRDGNEEMACEISDLVQTMEAHVSHELARSRIAPGPEHRFSDGNPGETVSDIARTLSRTPSGESIAWELDVPAGTLVKVDPNDLRELIGNIMENAVKWAAGKVSVRGVVKTGFIELRIEDDGPGIATEQIEQMMDRGKRFDEKTPGTGLGLAIVQDIADAYRLPINIQNRQTRGLCVIVQLPIAGPAAAADQ